MLINFFFLIGLGGLNYFFFIKRVILKYSRNIENSILSFHIHGKVYREYERREHYFTIFQKNLRILLIKEWEEMSYHKYQL